MTKWKYCPKCEEDFNLEYKYCPKCGTKLKMKTIQLHR